jgi:hypothetical protein
MGGTLRKEANQMTPDAAAPDDGFDQRLRFEAAENCADILRQYDRKAGCWRFSKSSLFWDAVALAHQEGRTGVGRRIAIVDGACDLSVGRLRAQSGGAAVMRGPGGEPMEHATAVALLISEVAPEARLDIYEVSRGGQPNLASIELALHRAAQSDAEIINLSIGHSVALGDAQHRCPLLDAAEEVIKRNKILVVACGNYRDGIVCPAHADAVAAVGYQSEQRKVLNVPNGGLFEVSAWQEPSFSQSLRATFTLMQPDGVLGSSFAAPLAAGLGALAHDPAELRDCKASEGYAADASDLNRLLDESAGEAPPQMLQLIAHYYELALQKLPHKAAVGDPYRCPACAVLTHWILVNAGRFCLFTDNLQAAYALLRRAHWLAPWSADAASTFGRLIECLAEESIKQGKPGVQTRAILQRAGELYEQALSLRPGNQVYASELDKIRALATSLSG